MSAPVVVIGFSGVSLPLGEMPFLKEWSATGFRAGLTFPPAISSVAAWTSLITGRGPAHHGIFDLYRRHSPGGQQLRVLASRDIECETIWAALDRQGLKATVLNYPMTFPAPKINGNVMPGSWVSSKRLKLGCYPGTLYQELGALEGVNLSEPNAEQLLRMLVYLLKKEPSDLSVVLIRDKNIDFAALDAQLKNVIEAAGPNATVLLISEPAVAEGLCLNDWLASRGYLAWSGPVDGKVLETADLNRQAASIDFTRTKAWSPPAGGNGVYLIEPDAHLAEELSSASGVSRVWKQQQLYAGPYQELAPDLVVEMSNSGVGTILGNGPAIKRGVTVSGLPLSSIAPFLFYTLGQQVPGDFEGSVPAEILDPAWIENHPLQSGAAASDREADKPLIAPEDEEEILRRLRGLGYLE